MADKPRRGLFDWLSGVDNKLDPKLAADAQAAEASKPKSNPAAIPIYEEDDDLTPAPLLPGSRAQAVVGGHNIINNPNERLVDQGELARGGMCSIRKTFNQNFLRHEAMKRLNPQFAVQPDELLRFIEEAQITAQLDHPNIPAVHELGVDAQGARYFTMKLVNGKTLEHIILDPKFNVHDELHLFQVMQIFIKVCDALAFAHSRGVVHCDLKPPNVMVGRFGEVYVMDWGIARLVHRERPSGAQPVVRIDTGRDQKEDDGKVMGTLAYMSPEQARGEVGLIDERSDIFSMGAILYQILTGKPPFEGQTTEETWAQAKECNVMEPEAAQKLRRGINAPLLPWKLCRLAMRCMAKDPAERPQAMSELQEELEDFLRGAGWHPVQTFKKGETIIREGDAGDTAYVIAQGRALVYRTVDGARVPLREMGQGDVFGETALLTSRPRSASVEAMDDLAVVMVSRQSLERELNRTFYVGHILKELANRFRDVVEQLSAQTRATAAATASAAAIASASAPHMARPGSRAMARVERPAAPVAPPPEPTTERGLQPYLDGPTLAQPSAPVANTAEQVLMFMNFRGTATESTRRMASWSRLRAHVAKRQGVTEEQAALIIRGLGYVEVDETEDRAVLVWDNH